MSKYKLPWDMFILVLAIITSFTVGFELVLLSLPDKIGYKVFTYTADFIFTIDILV